MGYAGRIPERVPKKVIGVPVEESTDVERLRADVEFLWSIIDDIDTASDIAKNNNMFYRTLVAQLQAKRHQRIYSDGYKLFVVQLTKEVLDE